MLDGRRGPYPQPEENPRISSSLVAVAVALAAKVPSVTLGFDDEKAGGPARELEAVVGDWYVGEADGKRGLMVDGSHWGIRANALENNLLFFKVMRGKRTIVENLRGVETGTRAWHELEVSFVGTSLTVLLDGKERLRRKLERVIVRRVARRQAPGLSKLLNTEGSEGTRTRRG